MYDEVQTHGFLRRVRIVAVQIGTGKPNDSIPALSKMFNWIAKESGEESYPFGLAGAIL